ncbi:MAG: GH116 family glycosyl-hydrolase [Myxococcota bacterium]
MPRRLRDFKSPLFDPERRVYRDSPTFRGFPLGGVGSGGISLFADGDFAEARTNHSWWHAARDLRGSFFAIRVSAGAGEPVAKLLRRTHHDSPELEVPNVAHTEFRGRVPSFDLAFEDGELPVAVSLHGMSPLVPQDLEESALPWARFQLRVRNPNDEAVRVSTLFSWQNVLGITGTGGSFFIARHTFRVDDSRHGFAEALHEPAPGVRFRIDKDYGPRDPRRRGIGQHAIATEASADVEVTRCLAWDPSAAVPPFWTEWRETGRLSDARAASRPGDGKAAALSVGFELAPGEERCVPFHLVWFMPHYVLEKNARLKILTGRHDGVDHGILPLRRFSGVDGLLRHVVSHRERLEQETLRLPRLLQDAEHCALPEWLVDVVLNSTDSVLTNSVLTRDGSYYTIEGMDWQLFHPLANVEWPFGALTGTNDQRLAGHPYTAVFLTEADRRELEIFGELAEHGKVPHGNGGAEIALSDTDTPYSHPIPLLNAGKSDWPDLTCSWVLQMGKLIKMTGDVDRLCALWPRFLEMAEYLERLKIDGVPEGASTYDIFVYEPCFLYTATLYVATNEMLADLAELLPIEIEPDPTGRAALFQRRAEEARAVIDRRLWNAERGYYRVCAGKNTLFQGGLAGDWISRLSGLPPAVPADRARSHSGWQHRALVEGARRAGSLPVRFGGRPLPFNEATEDGKEVPLRLFKVQEKRAFNYIYQAVAYQALEAIYLGRVEDGLDTIRMVYDKAYAEGYPWDMNLVGLPGFVYMTHPVMWALFHALTGAALDLCRGRLHLAPKPLPGDAELRCPVFFPGVWLGVRYDAEAASGEVRVLHTTSMLPEGSRIREVVLEGPDGERMTHALDWPLQLGGTLSFDARGASVTG